MPRPESPEGPWVTIPVRVRESLLTRIDGVLGDRNRSEWMRSLAEAALAGTPAPDPFEEHGFGRNAAPEGVPAVAFQEPAEPAPERQTAACRHPGVGRKQRCRACGAFNV